MDLSLKLAVQLAFGINSYALHTAVHVCVCIVCAHQRLPVNVSCSSRPLPQFCIAFRVCIYFQQINAARREICANKSFDDCSLPL